jgi:hypothetical protein
MGPWDPRIVKRDHSDHTDVNNFLSFHDSHIKFSALVESGDLSPPEMLEQSVGALADELNKNLTLYLGTLKDAVIKYSMENIKENSTCNQPPI